MGRMKGLGTGHLPSPSPWSGALPFSIELAQRLMVQPPHKSRALGAAHHSQSSACLLYTSDAADDWLVV